MDARGSYDRVAARYLAEVGGELAGKPLDRALLNACVELAGTGWVLDAGGGPGHVATYLSEQGARVIGSDLSVGMAALAHRSGAFPVVAADMTALPIGDGHLAGIVCLYAVIHLDDAGRAAAYAEFARSLSPGGFALVAFHVSDDETPTGGVRAIANWWDTPVDLQFHFLDPLGEIAAAERAGFELVARLDRAPNPGVEHASRRCYLLLRKT